MLEKTIDLLGVGSALLDILASVEDSFLDAVNGSKGGMNLVESNEIEHLCTLLPQSAQHIPGGSAANTIQGAARLGLATALLGKTGNDASGTLYRNSLEQNGVATTLMKIDTLLPTGRCCSLITPDSERTMRTFLGAAAAMSSDDISPDDFKGVARVHIEGYLLFNRDLFMNVVQWAKDAGCSISLDLASFEVVEANADILSNILEKYIDVVFANETEAAAYVGNDDPAVALKALTAVCTIAAVKLGADGALIGTGTETVRVSSPTVTALDTTGAGDMWAAGFLWALTRGRSLQECGDAGAILGSEVVQIMGAQIASDTWLNIKKRCNA